MKNVYDTKHSHTQIYISKPRVLILTNLWKYAWHETYTQISVLRPRILILVNYEKCVQHETHIRIIVSDIIYWF